MAEKAVGQAAGQRLPRAVHHKHDVRHLRQGRVAPLGERDDLVAVLPGVTHVVQHRLRLAALADGEHHRRGLRRVGQVVRVAEQHIVIEMDVVEHHKAADGQPLGDIGAHNVGKALAGGEQLGPARLVQQAAEPVQQLVGIIVDQALDILRAAVLAVGVELAAEVVVQLAVSVKAQPLAHLDDGGGGEKVLVGDLLDTHALLAALDMCRDAGDHPFLVLRKQICQQKIAVAHSLSLLAIHDIFFIIANRAAPCKTVRENSAFRRCGGLRTVPDDSRRQKRGVTTPLLFCRSRSGLRGTVSGQTQSLR